MTPFLRSLSALASGFVTLGIVTSVLMTRQPEFQARWALDAGEWGWALFAGGLGGVLAYPINRSFLARLGSRAMISRFGIAGGVTMALIPWLPGLPGLLLGLFLQGMIYSGVGVAVNQQAAEWELRHATRMMGRLHATFYVGSMVSAFVSSALAAVGLALWLHMAAVGLIAALLHCWTARQLPPPDSPAGEGGALRPIPAGAWQSLAVLAACHGIVESGVMGWSAIYLHQGLQATESAAGLGLALFSGAMALGRFLTDGMVSRFGPARVIAAGALACGAALGSSAALGALPAAMCGLAVSGLGLAAAAPIIFSAAGRMGGQTLALVASFNAVGGLLGPPVLGQVAKMVSLGAVMAVLAAVCLVMAWHARALCETVGGAGVVAAAEGPGS